MQACTPKLTYLDDTNHRMLAITFLAPYIKCVYQYVLLYLFKNLIIHLGFKNRDSYPNPKKQVYIQASNMLNWGPKP